VRITGGGNFGIATNAPTEILDVNGRTRIRTIDSTGTGTAMNMLYSDATGVIKKAAVPSGGITGTGITGYFPKWTGTSSQDTSQLFQLGRNIGIGTASPTYRLHLPDAGNTASQAMIAGTIFGSDGNGQTIVPGGNAMTLYGQGSDGFLYGAQVSGGKWGVNTRSLGDATFNVNGSVKIVTVDSTSTARNMLYADANGVIKKSAVPTGSGTIATAEADISANYTVTSTDHFVYLPALEGAGRYVLLPNDAANGRVLIIFNTSNDGTYKWTFTNEDVEDAAGAPVTTLTNQKSYTMVYYDGKFRVTAIN
jgi:hypothetical protein